MNELDYLEEACKVISLNENSMKRARDYVVKSDGYTGDVKIKLLDIIETSFSKKKQIVRTTEYDGKPYAMVFMDNLLDFIFKNDFTKNEQQIIYAIYKVLNSTNSFGNVLISVNHQQLSQIANVNTTNISRIFKSLIGKGFLKKDKFGSIYLNYHYFFKGSKLQYDEYKEKYDAVEC